MSGTVFEATGLSAGVDILIDRWGIPHIYAATVDDLFFAQGFNAARDRLFQIDLWRRKALGQLADVFGPDYVDEDRAARLLLFRGDMDDEWRAYDPRTRGTVERFVAGINAYLDWLDAHPDQLPPEFGLADYRPARWSAADVVRPRGHAPAYGLLTQHRRALVVAAAGVDADLIRQPLARGHRPVVTAETVLDVPEPVLRDYLLATGRPGPLPGTASGSNCWAVAAHRTGTGRPVLAADPHRGYTTPALRYLTHLSAPGLDVIGAGEPQMPGITLGHNGTAAFGFTVCPMVSEELLVCALDREPISTVFETIEVRDEPSRRVPLRFTAHGPVLDIDPRRGRCYVLRTTWTQPGTAPYFGSLAYLTATSWTEFDKALESWRLPGETHVYADVGGTIARRTAGLIPRRDAGTGLLPRLAPAVPEAEGWFAPADFATAVDPPEGFVATANQCNVPEELPLPTYEWPSDARYRRIVEVLSAPGDHALDDSARLQTDLLSVTARAVVALLRESNFPAPDRVLDAALRLLRAWDAVESADSAAAALFEVWWSSKLGPAFVAARVPAAAVPVIARPHARAVLDWLLDPPDAAERDHLVAVTLRAAWNEVVDLLGADPAGWAWGLLHRSPQPHLFEHLDCALGVAPVPVGGSDSTVAAAAYVPPDFSTEIGASIRLLIDVGAWDNSRCVNTPGQAGDPGSPHYRDLHNAWRTGDYVPLLYTRAAVERAIEHRIRLEPRDRP
ncbi:penicillin acylase family protein [Nocardia brasiliensis]|uniref:Penicillin amidase n=1 Tax=Nocardia brasiliensis (strain ATCC 700358 / HUJEG-1) TaxID=1133849 RepID=K0EVE6_NOCB7|nr:penicillin acylase family protein [Nocardia brasiliensis]AFT99545.1 Penicillin amidase [Nocardia brasiliensis ATCC 700358]OCF90494.1 hypothetical protein AW168_11030 [Nocardia brasiliensis]